MEQTKTDKIKTSKIGLGLAALGRPGYINLGHNQDFNLSRDRIHMQKHCSQVLDEALKLGITYFDTARSYGAAEDFLASWLHNISYAKKLTIGSKWGYRYTADWKVNAKVHEVKEHSLSHLKKQTAESNAILGDNLDIYHIHSATIESGVLDNTEVLDELWRIKEKGIVIGLSVSGPKQAEVIERALDIKTGSELLFGSVQATYNILEVSAEEALIKASEAGLFVIVKEAVANGRLTNRNKNTDFAESMQIITKISEKYRVTPDALALAFVLSKKWVNTVLSGAATTEQLQSNCKAMDVLIDGPDMAILQDLYEEKETYWSRRKALEWN